MTEIDDADTATEAIPLDKLVAIHAKIKARMEALDKELAELEEQRTEVRLAIKDQMKALGLTSVQTSNGTVSLMKNLSGREPRGCSPRSELAHRVRNSCNQVQVSQP